MIKIGPYFVDADSVAGYIYIRASDNPDVYLVRLTEPESELLRPVLQRAEQVVSSGFGDMKDRSEDEAAR